MVPGSLHVLQVLHVLHVLDVLDVLQVPRTYLLTALTERVMVPASTTTEAALPMEPCQMP